MARISKAEYLEALERSGMTGHPGGIAGTERLVGRLGLKRDERVLDLGCGTGYTACLLAKGPGARVVGLDLRPKMLGWAKKRALKEGVADRVHLAAGDAHCMPFREGSFNAAVIESVLVFCDVPAALAELYRALKPGGRLGCNEVTALRPIAEKQKERFGETFGASLAIATADEWARALEGAGFTDVSAEAGPINWLDVSLITPLRTDGIGRYLSALARSVTDPKFRKISREKWAFLTSGLLRDLGSGTYWARKPLTR